MAQRGGSVVTYVKMDKKVYSPLVEKGEADIILAFEQLEALRWVEYLTNGGSYIINTQRIDPIPVILGKEKYPESIVEKINGTVNKTIAVDALPIARECGNIKAVNVVLLGVLAKVTGIGKEIWIESIRETVPPKLQEINFKAFEAGYALSV
jgi:indolepyruvate ferredoxin oxidoreductase beta subunit